MLVWCFDCVIDLAKETGTTSFSKACDVSSCAALTRELYGDKTRPARVARRDVVDKEKSLPWNRP